MLLNSTLMFWISHVFCSLLNEPSRMVMPRTGRGVPPGTLVKVAVQMKAICLQFQGPTSTMTKGMLSGWGEGC